MGDLQNNALQGLAGNDLLLGGAGNDSINGGDGDDFMIGGEGDDNLVGSSGTDVVSYLTAAAGVTVSLDASTGKGSFLKGELSTSARGVRDSSDVEAFYAPNPKPLELTVNWQNTTQCALHGELAGTVNADEKRCENSDVVCTTDASV